MQTTYTNICYNHPSFIFINCETRISRGDRTYTPDELSRKIRHVKHGCIEDSETYEHMLHEAYDICKAEVDQEMGNMGDFEKGE